MTERQIKALNTLFAATTEVMEAFAPEDVSAAQRREALSRMIENFLISASSPSNGIVYNEVPKSSIDLSASGSNSNVLQNQSYIAETATSSEARKEVSAAGESPITEETETRYAISPILMDDGYCFKRLKLEEDRDSDTQYPYIVTIGETSGTFAVEGILKVEKDDKIEDVYGSEEFKKTFPEMVVEISEQGKSPNEATKLISIEPGMVEKVGKNWKITKRVKAIYE